MKKNWLFILAFSFSILAAKAQDPATRIKNNAIKIERPETLNRQVYSALSGYRVIMAGEMHGTNEPAKLITGLARLITGMGDSVMVGMEIPVGHILTTRPTVPSVRLIFLPKRRQMAGHRMPGRR